MLETKLKKQWRKNIQNKPHMSRQVAQESLAIFKIYGLNSVQLNDAAQPGFELSEWQRHAYFGGALPPFELPENDNLSFKIIKLI